jgi:2-isopropylmalate synthase
VPRRWATASGLGPLNAVTGMLVESTDHAGSWTTVGVHGNVVEAALRARTPAR